MTRAPERILTAGYGDGYEGRFPRERDKRYLAEYAWGREQKASEHVEGRPGAVWGTALMARSADCRVIRGSFSKG